MTNGDRRPGDETTESTTSRSTADTRGNQGDRESDPTVDDQPVSVADTPADTQPTSTEGRSLEEIYSIESSETPDRPQSLWRRLRTADDGPLLLLREVAISLSIVFLLGGLLFGLSGVWPPMVAVESESMEPNIKQYDLIFVTEPGRFSPSEADQVGIVTADSTDESEYASFNTAGSVIVFDPPGTGGPPIIHRAHFFVESGENWYDRANPEYVSAGSCADLRHCPAPHDGYITKGDNAQSNAQYDQANGIATVVSPDWVTGVARLRLPYAGYIRLALVGAASSSPLVPVGLGAIAASGAYAIGRRELMA